MVEMCVLYPLFGCTWHSMDPSSNPNPEPRSMCTLNFCAALLQTDDNGAGHSKEYPAGQEAYAHWNRVSSVLRMRRAIGNVILSVRLIMLSAGNKIKAHAGDTFH